jgi:hypothetical protein
VVSVYSGGRFIDVAGASTFNAAWNLQEQYNKQGYRDAKTGQKLSFFENYNINYRQPQPTSRPAAPTPPPSVFGWDVSGSVGRATVGYGSDGFSAGGTILSKTRGTGAVGIDYGTSGWSASGLFQIPLSPTYGLAYGYTVGTSSLSVGAGGYVGIPYTSYQATGLGSVSVSYGGVANAIRSTANDIAQKIVEPIVNPTTYYAPSNAVYGYGYSGGYGY